MKTTASQAPASVQLCRGRGHDHGRDLGLCVSNSNQQNVLGFSLPLIRK
jgi:hypothetical protein